MEMVATNLQSITVKVEDINGDSKSETVSLIFFVFTFE